MIIISSGLIVLALALPLLTRAPVFVLLPSSSSESSLAVVPRTLVGESGSGVLSLHFSSSDGGRGVGEGDERTDEDEDEDEDDDDDEEEEEEERVPPRPFFSPPGVKTGSAEGMSSALGPVAFAALVFFVDLACDLPPLAGMPACKHICVCLERFTQAYQTLDQHAGIYHPRQGIRKCDSSHAHGGHGAEVREKSAFCVFASAAMLYYSVGLCC